MKTTIRIMALLVTLIGASAQAVETIYYYHNDQLGTPQKMTDENQTVVWDVDYAPFGLAVGTATIENNLRFPGQYYDKESGLHYNYFRDYDPQLGRYMQSDPIGLAGGINTYGYVGGNPVKWFDPYGLFGMWPFGNPLGGNMNSPAPVPLPSGNASLGAGGTAMVGPGYVGADSGIAVDTTGNIEVALFV